MDAVTSRPARSQRIRRVSPGMRVLLIAFCVLTALATVALFVMAERTADFFAWTIQPPLTAAFLGAGYAAGFVLVVLSLRDPVWVDSRVAVLTILAFVVLTLTATLIHLDRFHFMAEFAASGFLAKAAAWFWLGVYIVIPVAMLALLVPQERSRGLDPPARRPVPLVLRVALGLESVVLTVTGVVLYVAPTTAERLWPWALTPLTARVVAAWLIAFGLATALASVAGDLRRLRTAAIAYTVFGALVIVSLIRFFGTLDWDDPPTIAFALVSVAIVATGAAGWALAPKPRRIRRRAGAHAAA
ncbi:hypothetical protein [Geodermatophilus sp. URMC 64]